MLCKQSVGDTFPITSVFQILKIVYQQSTEVTKVTVTFCRFECWVLTVPFFVKLLKTGGIVGTVDVINSLAASFNVLRTTI